MGVAILILLVLAAWAASRLAPLFRAPHLHQLERFHASLAADREKVVVCLGDSLTQGNVSFDYVYALASRLEPDGYTVLNAGVNGDLAWNVLERVDAVVSGQPAYVVLLVGTNDVRACETDRAAARYVRRKNLPRMPDADFFRESYGGILDALASNECTRTIVVTIPPLGERAGEPIDEVVERFNGIVAAEASARDASCLDLHGTLERRLAGGDRESAPAYDGRRARLMLLRAVVLRQLFGWSWNRIARHNGMRLLTDGVHLDEAAGAELVDLVEQAVRRKVETGR